MIDNSDMDSAMKPRRPRGGQLLGSGLAVLGGLVCLFATVAPWTSSYVYTEACPQPTCWNPIEEVGVRRTNILSSEFREIVAATNPIKQIGWILFGTSLISVIAGILRIQFISSEKFLKSSRGERSVLVGLLYLLCGFFGPFLAYNIADGALSALAQSFGYVDTSRISGIGPSVAVCGGLLLAVGGLLTSSSLVQRWLLKDLPRLAKRGFRPGEVDVDSEIDLVGSRVISRNSIVFSHCEDGLSLSSSARNGVMVGVLPIGGSVMLDRMSVTYRSTVLPGPNGDELRIDERLAPVILPSNKEKLHTPEVNFPFVLSDRDTLYAATFGKRPGRSKEHRRADSRRVVRGQIGDSTLLQISPVFYFLDPSYSSAFKSLQRSVQTGMSRGKIYFDRATWENVGIERWKGQSGSRYTVDRKTTKIHLSDSWDTLPTSSVRLVSNLRAPRFSVDTSRFWVLPDVVIFTLPRLGGLASAWGHAKRELLGDSLGFANVKAAAGKFAGAFGGTEVSFVGHENVDIELRKTEYVIPVGKVPRGSSPIGYTWEYVNKDGSPDRRYNDNERLAIINVVEVACVVDEIVLFCLIFSNERAGEEFADALKELSSLAKSSLSG